MLIIINFVNNYCQKQNIKFLINEYNKHKKARVSNNKMINLI